MEPPSMEASSKKASMLDADTFLKEYSRFTYRVSLSHQRLVFTFDGERPDASFVASCLKDKECGHVYATTEPLQSFRDLDKSAIKYIFTGDPSVVEYGKELLWTPRDVLRYVLEREGVEDIERFVRKFDSNTARHKQESERAEAERWRVAEQLVADCSDLEETGFRYKGSATATTSSGIRKGRKGRRTRRVKDGARGQGRRMRRE